jgi:hypothetical protein
MDISEATKILGYWEQIITRKLAGLDSQRREYGLPVNPEVRFESEDGTGVWATTRGVTIFPKQESGYSKKCELHYAPKWRGFNIDTLPEIRSRILGGIKEIEKNIQDMKQKKMEALAKAMEGYETDVGEAELLRNKTQTQAEKAEEIKEQILDSFNDPSYSHGYKRRKRRMNPTYKPKYSYPKPPPTPNEPTNDFVTDDELPF